MGGWLVTPKWLLVLVVGCQVLAEGRCGRGRGSADGGGPVEVPSRMASGHAAAWDGGGKVVQMQKDQ